MTCARRSLGEARHKQGITAVAKECGTTPHVVLAAFGFLPDSRRPKRYVDVWQDDETIIDGLGSGRLRGGSGGASSALTTRDTPSSGRRTA